MELFETIFNRRTIKDFKPDPVPDSVLDRVLTAGTWAQNHRLTQPWRFVVLGPETRASLAALAGDIQSQAPQTDNDGAGRAKANEGARRKILSKPLIVAVTYRFGSDKQQRIEDFAATCCAIQNIQLAAWSEGLGMQWSTGKLVRDPRMPALLNFNPEEEEIAGLLYFGYPAAIPPAQPRKPLAEVTRRLP